MAYTVQQISDSLSRYGCALITSNHPVVRASLPGRTKPEMHVTLRSINDDAVLGRFRGVFEMPEIASCSDRQVLFTIKDLTKGHSSLFGLRKPPRMAMRDFYAKSPMEFPVWLLGFDFRDTIDHGTGKDIPVDLRFLFVLPQDVAARLLPQVIADFDYVYRLARSFLVSNPLFRDSWSNNFEPMGSAAIFDISGTLPDKDKPPVLKILNLSRIDIQGS